MHMYHVELHDTTVSKRTRIVLLPNGFDSILCTPHKKKNKQGRKFLFYINHWKNLFWNPVNQILKLNFFQCIQLFRLWYNPKNINRKIALSLSLFRVVYQTYTRYIMQREIQWSFLNVRGRIHWTFQIAYYIMLISFSNYSLKLLDTTKQQLCCSALLVSKS